jgi:hypothetical protein
MYARAPRGRGYPYLSCCKSARVCHTWFWKVNRMRTMYVPGSETHVHRDYIIGHHDTLLKINSGKGTLLHQDFQDIHRVINITLSFNVIKVRNTKRSR